MTKFASVKVEKALLVRIKIEAAKRGIPIYALIAKLIHKAAPELGKAA